MKLEKRLLLMWLGWFVALVMTGLILFSLSGSKTVVPLDSTIPEQYVFPIWIVIIVLGYMTFCLLAFTLCCLKNDENPVIIL